VDQVKVKQVNWGIIGCGGIAEKFASSIAGVKNTRIVAAASKSFDRATAFTARHGGTALDNYEALLSSESVDAVYIATTHNFHFDNVKSALMHGKSVLCEKPLTMNAGQARELAGLARQNGCFFMEGMWTRFLPAISRLRQLLDENTIGTILQFRADFGFNAEFDENHRLFKKDLAGGSLLDGGIYPVSLASMIMKTQPESIKAFTDIGRTGVDEQTVVLFRYGTGCLAVLSSNLKASLENRVEIFGDKGKITIPGDFLAARQLQIQLYGNNTTVTETYPFPDAEGFRFEIEEAVNLISAGKLESTVMPPDETVAIMETIDRIRKEIGLSYDCDTR